MTADFQIIAGNVAQVRERIARAAERSGRTEEAVRLVAVTKYASPTDGVVEALTAAGCWNLAENRPQKLLDKWEVFGSNKQIRWHFIGTLQKNKIRKVIGKTVLIHSIDSVELAYAVDRIVDEEKIGVKDVLLEVNISGDGNKHGFEPDELMDRLGEILPLPHLAVQGFMGMGGLESTRTEVRRQFARLRELRDLCRAAFPARSFDTLSMGMSGDFETAVEEGSTLVRIGSALY